MTKKGDGKMDECIFCKIVKGDIPSAKVYEDERTFAFDDIQPMAPVHVLIVPKGHVETVMDLAEDDDLAKDLLTAAQKVARIKKVDRSGFRLVVNCGSDGGQIVSHLHLHLLGGKKLADEMG